MRQLACVFVCSASLTQVQACDDKRTLKVNQYHHLTHTHTHTHTH